MTGTASKWLAEILECFGAVPLRSRPGTWVARCPAHDDHAPSLSLWLGRDGRLMLGCWTGCEKSRILACKGMRMRDLFPPRTEGAYGARCHDVLPPRRVVTTYDYCDETGTLLYQAVRYEPKDFRQRRPDGAGGWTWNLDGVRLVLYRLPELLAAPPAATIFVCEGEKKADALIALGLVATSNVGGCGMGWLPSYSLALTGRHVVILPDCDTAGTKHAFGVAGSLISHGAAGLRIVLLPGLGQREDVCDWLTKGGTTLELRKIVWSFPEWRPSC